MNYKEISKISIYSILMGIFSIIGIIYFAISVSSFSEYNFSSLQDSVPFDYKNLMPVYIQGYRAWSAASMIICILLTSLIIWEIKKMESANYKKYFISSLGVFTWIIIPYTLYIGIKNKSYSQFFNYISQNKVEQLQISFNSIKGGLIGGKIKDKLFWNTVLSVFVFLITLVSFIFCFLITENIYGVDVVRKINPDKLNVGWGASDADKLQNYYSYLEQTAIFQILIYFTQLSNIACFIFMSTFILFNKKIMFRNNTIMIGVTSYIFIVSAIYWCYLFPTSFGKNHIMVFEWAKTTWLHAVTPFAFILFSVSSFFVSKQAPKSFKNIIGISIIFPLFYGLFTFSLPFYARVSTYGTLTNMNPNMSTIVGKIKDGGTPITSNGSPWMTLAFVLLFVIFILVIFMFWSIAYLINKKELKRIK